MKFQKKCFKFYNLHAELIQRGKMMRMPKLPSNKLTQVGNAFSTSGRSGKRKITIKAVDIEKFIAELNYRFEKKERFEKVLKIVYCKKFSKPIITYDIDEPKRIVLSGEINIEKYYFWQKIVLLK